MCHARRAVPAVAAERVAEEALALGALRSIYSILFTVCARVNINIAEKTNNKPSYALCTHPLELLSS